MAFQPVNTTLVTDRPLDLHEEIKTPTTPRAPVTQGPSSHETPSTRNIVASTRDLSLAGMPSQNPPSNSSFGFHDNEVSAGMMHHGPPNQAAHTHRHGEDMDLDASDDEQDGSDNDTENGEPGRSSKKKKGQRFFCTEYPPCNLSFTRSEHLARHIRKHTGERPFQCHCNRRFSRLDNLRQHAQTVHVNEDIPAESLAATGTRYQRQIRTEKLRPATSRARSGTLGSQGGHSRGHSRNLSTSSIGSVTSSYSATDSRRRPPPLLMATDGAARSSGAMERPSTPPSQYRAYSTNPPSGMTTPTSATYSNNPGSPGYGSFMESPISGTSRPSSLYASRAPARRLSVPSSGNTFHFTANPAHTHPYISPPLPSSSSAFSNQSSTFASPTASHFSGLRYEPGLSPAEAELRRRTWHPTSYAAPGFNFSRPATSALSFSQTPDTVQPPLTPHTPSAASQAPRLPGIESFDQVQERPSTPPRRQPSPMQVDTPPQRNVFPSPSNFSRPTAPVSDHRRGHFSWDGSNNGRFGGPVLQSNSTRDSPSWNQQAPSNTARLPIPPIIHQNQPLSQPAQGEQRQQPNVEPYQGPPNKSQRTKRLGWYNGPLTNQTARRSPEDSSSSEGVPTPGTSAAELHPAIVNSNGYIEPHHPGLPVEAHANVST